MFPESKIFIRSQIPWCSPSKTFGSPKKPLLFMFSSLRKVSPQFLSPPPCLLIYCVNISTQDGRSARGANYVVNSGKSLRGLSICVCVCVCVCVCSLQKVANAGAALFQGRSARTSTCPFSRWSRCKSSPWTKQCCWHANRAPKKSSSPTSSGPTRAARPSSRTSECAAGCRPNSAWAAPSTWLIDYTLYLFLSHWLITTARHEILQPLAGGWFCIPQSW